MTARATIIIDAKNQATGTFDSIMASWRTQIEATGKATAEANLKMAGGLKALVTEARTAKDQFSQTARVVTESGQAAEKASGGFKIFGMNVVDIAAKLYLVQTAIRGVINVMQEGLELAELGAQVKQSDISFQNLLDTLGAAPDTMDRLRAAAGGLATDYELQSKSAIVLTGTSGELGKTLADNLPRLLEIARAAKVVNPAIRDVDYAYESLTTGIKRGEKRWLDNIGIIFNASDAYEEYAEKNGLVATELTATEKQLAFLQKTLQVGDTIINQAGGSVDSLTDRYGRLRTQLEETRQGFGVFFDTAFGPAVDQLTEQIGIVNSTGNAWVDLGSVIAPLIADFQKLMFTISLLNIAMRQFDDVDMVDKMNGLTDILSESSGAVAKQGVAELGLVDVHQTLTNFTMELSEAQTEAIGSTKLLTDAQKEELSGLVLLGSAGADIAKMFMDSALAAEENRAATEGLNSTEKQLYELLLSIGRIDAAEMFRDQALAHIDAAEAAKIQAEAEKALADGWADFKQGFQSLVPEIGEGEKSFDEMRQAVVDAQEALDALGEEQQIWIEGTTKLVIGNEAVNETAEEMEDRQRKIVALTNDLDAAFIDLTETQAEWGDATAEQMPKARNEIAQVHDKIAELQDRIEDLTGTVITQEGYWGSNAGMIEKAREELEKAKTELEGYTREISSNVLGLAEYELKFLGAFNEENLGILKNFAVEMGLLDQNTFEAQEAMKALFDPMNNLPAEVKAEGLEAINEALATGVSPMSAYEGVIKTAADNMTDLIDRHELDMPQALAILKGKFEEETPPMVAAIGTLNTEYGKVQDTIAIIVEESTPAITTATETMQGETEGFITAFQQNWNNALSQLWLVSAEIEKIGRLIANLPSEKTITVNVNQVGGVGGAYGLDMIVPPGYPDDTFPIRASSGERVTIAPTGMNAYAPAINYVTPGSKGDSDDGDTRMLIGSIHAALQRMPMSIGRAVRDQMRQGK